MERIVWQKGWSLSEGKCCIKFLWQGMQQGKVWFKFPVTLHGCLDIYVYWGVVITTHVYGYLKNSLNFYHNSVLSFRFNFIIKYEI